MIFFLFREEHDTEKAVIEEELFVYEFQLEMVESGQYNVRGLR